WYRATTYDNDNAFAVSSTSGGSSWSSSTNRDIAFRFTVGTSAYRPSGYLMSSWFDSGSGATTWGIITFNHSLPSGTADNVWVQVSDDNTVVWSASGGTLSSGTNLNLTGRYLRYRVRLDANQGLTLTPSFYDVSVDWSQAAASTSYLTIRVGTPLNDNMSYDSSTPANADVLYSADGSSWTARTQQPIYVLDVDTNTSGTVDVHEGSPYDRNLTYGIYGNNYASVRFTVSGEVSGKTKVTRGFYVYVRKPGAATDPLRYTLVNVTDSENLVTGQVATAAQLGASWGWRYVQVENALVEGKDYRLVLWTTDANGYEWMAPGRSVSYIVTERTTFDGTNTFGSTSASAGAGWTDNTMRDAIFRFKTASSFPASGWLESSVFDAGEVVDWTSMSASSS
ncbi:MAG: hypothetical protein AB1744_15140, partial [Candidatus Zixiibacteriota bacterium]